MEKGNLVRGSEPGSVSIVAPGRVGQWQSGPARPESNADPEIRYRAILRRHAKFVFAIMLSCFVAGLLVTAAMGTKYKAKAIIEILPVNQDFMNAKDVDPNSRASAADAYLDTQTRILSSQSVANRVVAKLVADSSQQDVHEPDSWMTSLAQSLGLRQGANDDLKVKIRKALAGMKVKAEGQSSLISITVTAPSPQLAADIANTVATEHIAALQDARFATAMETGDFVSSQLQGLLKKLRASENELQAYARRTGIIYTARSEQESVASERLREIQADLAKAEADRADKQAQLDLATNSSPDALPKVLDDGSLREASSRLSELQRQLAGLNATYTPNYYKSQELQSQISELKTQVNQGRAAIVTRIKNDYHTAVRREAIQKAEYDHQLAVVQDQSSKELGYSILKREVDANHDLYQSMLQKTKEATVVAAVRSSNIRIVDHATPPGSPYQPNLLLNTALAALAGAMLSVLFILLRERSDGSIRTAGETVRLLQLPELAIIPSARRDIRTQIVGSARGKLGRTFLGEVSPKQSDISTDLVASWLHTGSIVAESFRSAVASIILWGRERALAHKVLVITSPHASAGKTTSVLNLGLGLAESGRRVLLIDGDLRLPRLGNVFGLDGAPGLTNLLTEGSGFIDHRQVIHQTGLPGLFVMPSGPREENVTQMLHSNRLETLIGSIRGDFDFILIDSPPALPITDARLLAQHADGVILIVRAGATTPEQSMAVQRSFMQDGTYLFGSILNNWNARAEDPAFMNSYMKYGGAYGKGSDARSGVGGKKRAAAAGK